jgi:hypothetical protein
MDPDTLATLMYGPQDETGKRSGSGFKIGGGQLLVAKGFRFEVADPTTAARQGMIDKAEEMAALGARFVQPGTAVKTATQSRSDDKTAHSVLSLACVNVEDGYQWACETAARYMNLDPGAVEVKISRQFMEPEITAEKMREIRENVLAGLLPLESAFRAAQRAGDLPPEMTFEEFESAVSEAGTLVERQVEQAMRDRAAALQRPGDPAQTGG